MTTQEKNTALQALKDAQRAIEDLETEWTKAYKAGQETDTLDHEFDRLLSTRRGIERLMIDLGIKFSRKDYREIDIKGNSKLRTMWYLL